MVALPTRYYVQRSQSASSIGASSGWDTVIVTFDRALAEQFADRFERGLNLESPEGKTVDVSEFAVVVARVMTAEELRAESDDALFAAEVATRLQFWQRLEEWAAPLLEPPDEPQEADL